MYFTAKCGCKLDAWVKRGCYGHPDDDYCYCPEDEVEDAIIIEPCTGHGGTDE